MTNPQYPQNPAAMVPAQQQQVQPAAQQTGLPQIYLPDEAMVQAAYAKAQEEQARIARARAGGGGGDLHWFSPMGPNGETKWGNVPAGYEVSYVFWLCPPSAQGKMPHVEDRSHFYRTAEKPGGTGITCPGDGCFVCAARNGLFRSGNQADTEKANAQGKASRRAIYQIILLEYYEHHFIADGRMVPWLFRAPGGLHDDIVEKLKNKTAVRVLDPQYGRPLVLKKRKTGKDAWDVEWSIDDLDPSPLHEAFYPVLHNLYDLDRFVKMPTLQEQYEAIVAMNFPVPPELPGLAAQQAAQIAAQAQQPALGAGQPQQQMLQQPQVQQGYPPQGFVQGAPQQPVTMQQSPGGVYVVQGVQPAYAPGPQAPAQSPYPQQAAPAGPPGLAALQGQLKGY